MTKEQKKELRIARAKRTAFGRFLCRLMGEQTGAVMMEYVVLGVMVVAAVVALVMLFGEQIRVNFVKMIKSLKGEPDAAAQVQNVNNENQAQSTGNTITGGEAGTVTTGQ